MKTQEQLDKEMPARLLSAACAIIAAVHFYNCGGKADFVLLGFVVLCAAPWLGGIFKSISKDGLEYRDGFAPAPPVLPAAALGNVPNLVAPAQQQAPSGFSTMASQEKKVLATLWKYQKMHFQDRRDQRWTFVVAGQNQPEHTEFSLGFLLLAAKGFATVAPSGQIMLTNAGYDFCLNHNAEILAWPRTYDNFSN